MKKRQTTLLIGLFITLQLFAQKELPPAGGGSHDQSIRHTDEMTPEQRKAIIRQLKQNEQTLRKKGKLPATRRTASVSFQWPLKQAPGFYDNGYSSVSSYVDHNPNFPNQLLDYNCGTRTYDLSSGYNHKGTDFYIWPFAWQKMQKNAVQVIAAASGVIVGKMDGHPDQNCTFCVDACGWNAVFIKHADGTVAWYGHLKMGSLLAKEIGETVAAGEYLGIVGSSGSSKGPHLHLEVYTEYYVSLIDPWAGPCNTQNGDQSRWTNQEPYYVPTLNKIMTHGKLPRLDGCPENEAVNQKINFSNTDTVFLIGYYRDQQTNQQSVHTIFLPDGTVYASWTQTFNQTYIYSWWYYYFVLPSAAKQGMWRYTVAFNGNPPQTAYFAVNTTGYVFTGRGNWSDPHNWLAESKPPAQLPGGHEIIIAPIDGEDCIVDQPQQINAGGKLRIESGKKLILGQNLIVL